MIPALPFSESYNLSRLGQAGDEVRFAADADMRAAIARWASIVSVEDFTVTVTLRKLSPSRFALDYKLEADVVQACVATLAPVPAHLARAFIRELHFSAPLRRGGQADSPEPPLVLSDEPEPPEEIESLHYDLAAPALEEFALALDPYPRAPGAEFALPGEPGEARENPFAVLKRLKTRP